MVDYIIFPSKISNDNYEFMHYMYMCPFIFIYNLYIIKIDAMSSRKYLFWKINGNVSIWSLPEP